MNKKKRGVEKVKTDDKDCCIVNTRPTSTSKFIVSQQVLVAFGFITNDLCRDYLGIKCIIRLDIDLLVVSYIYRKIGGEILWRSVQQRGIPDPLGEIF